MIIRDWESRSPAKPAGWTIRLPTAKVNATAARSTTDTTILNADRLKAHVGTYIPKSTGYSFAKNQKADTARNNMRQITVILHRSSYCHYRKLVSHVFSSFR